MPIGLWPRSTCWDQRGARGLSASTTARVHRACNCRLVPVSGTQTIFIDPGSPWQNAWIESFNGRLRDELLNAWHFDTLLEAKVLIEDWRVDYNDNRPHSAHGDLAPSEFARAHMIKSQPVPA